MLLALIRRIPRTKSVFERTSSRRHSSSVDYDCNGFDETSSESLSTEHNNASKLYSNQFNSFESISLEPQQPDSLENGSLNGHHYSLNAIDDENNHDEYASFHSIILTHFTLLVFLCD